MNKYCTNCRKSFTTTLDGRCPNCDTYDNWYYGTEEAEYAEAKDKDGHQRYEYKKFVPLHYPDKKPTLTDVTADVSKIQICIDTIQSCVDSLYQMRFTSSDHLEHAKIFKEDMQRELNRICNQAGIGG